jgi:PAS domain S-box-containing protein
VPASPQVLVLPPEPLSVRTARRHVVQALVELGKADWADDAGLAVTEIVANVVLHARTACEVAVEVSDQGARIAVRDFDPTPPVQMRFSPYATTGRGLSVVAALSRDFGIELLGTDGKVVWFLLDGSAVVDDAEPGGEWDLSDLLADTGADAGEAAVTLRGVPTALWMAALEHESAVLRELLLLQASTATVTDAAGPVDHTLPDAADQLASAGTAQRLLALGTSRALEAAAAQPWLSRLDPLPQGHPAVVAPTPAQIDVEIALDGSGTLVFGAYQDVLDRGRDLARQGLLLVRPTLDEVVALRGWACDQVIAQATGVTALAWDPDGPWSRSLEHRDGSDLQWDDAVVRTSHRAVVAADDSNRIIAVSDAAAELLGGGAADLIGLRITSLIPARLREQHVAGFTRHLTTGESRVLGVALNLPVVRLDGVELVRRFYIEQVPASTGRHVYVAWLDPVPEAGAPAA